MKLQVQLFVPGPDGIGVLTVDRTYSTLTKALEEAAALVSTVKPDRSMLRVQGTDNAQANTVLIAFVRNGAWEPYRYPFFFGAQPTG